MSDTFEVTADGPEDLGQVDLVDGAEETALEVEEVEEFLDIEQFRNHRVPVKVDGEDRFVPLSEAAAGYQRQADYTRKTQELAQQKAELQWGAAIRGALENDPQGTLELLANQFGVKPIASAAQVDDPFDFSNPWDEPVDTKYREIEQRLELFEQERANQQLDATIRHLSEKYGEDFDANEVVVAAMATGSIDLEATFRQITFDKIRDKAARAEAQLAKTQQNRAAKRDAGVVSGGSSAGGSTGVDVGAITTIADAWRAAKAQHGV